MWKLSYVGSGLWLSLSIFSVELELLKLDVAVNSGVPVVRRGDAGFEVRSSSVEVSSCCLEISVEIFCCGSIHLARFTCCNCQSPINRKLNSQVYSISLSYFNLFFYMTET